MFWHIQKFFIRLKRSLSWFIFMWTNEDWDYSFLYDVIDKKLASMEKLFKTSIFTTKNSLVRLIRLARTYMKLARQDEFAFTLYKQFEAKYGRSTCKMDNINPATKSAILIFGFKKDDTLIFDTDPEYKRINKLYIRVLRRISYRKIEYRRRLFYILNKYMEYFWD